MNILECSERPRLLVVAVIAIFLLNLVGVVACAWRGTSPALAAAIAGASASFGILSRWSQETAS